jgi:drug/metabolite transporter (DMT)-like permease
MRSIVFALIALVGWGTGDLLVVVASRRLGAVRAALWSYLCSLVALALVLPFSPVHVADLAGGPGLLSALLGFLLVGCVVSFNEAMRTGNPAVVGTICGAFVAPVVLFSIAFLHEALSAGQAAAIVVILAGLVLTVLAPHGGSGTTRRLHRWIVLALLTMLGWGVVFTFIKLPVHSLGPFWPTYIINLVGMVALLSLDRGRHLGVRVPERRGLGAAASSALIGSAATVSYNAAVGGGNTAIVAPIAGSYPVLFVLLSAAFFKAPVARQQVAGMAITLGGVVALSVVAG